MARVTEKLLGPLDHAVPLPCVVHADFPGSGQRKPFLSARFSLNLRHILLIQ